MRTEREDSVFSDLEEAGRPATPRCSTPSGSWCTRQSAACPCLSTCTGFAAGARLQNEQMHKFTGCKNVWAGQFFHRFLVVRDFAKISFTCSYVWLSEVGRTVAFCSKAIFKTTVETTPKVWMPVYTYVGLSPAVGIWSPVVSQRLPQSLASTCPKPFSFPLNVSFTQQSENAPPYQHLRLSKSYKWTKSGKGPTTIEKQPAIS